MQPRQPQPREPQQQQVSHPPSQPASQPTILSVDLDLEQMRILPYPTLPSRVPACMCLTVHVDVCACACACACAATPTTGTATAMATGTASSPGTGGRGGGGKQRPPCRLAAGSCQLNANIRGACCAHTCMHAWCKACLSLTLVGVCVWWRHVVVLSVLRLQLLPPRPGC